jgi:predicted regulator of Ras-like GTPase activity (Roadblock/LC7/MglB family)
VTKAGSPLVVLLARLTRLPDVRLATLATREGLLVAAAGAADGAELRSATTAALFGALDRSMPSLQFGELESATVETTAYTLFLHGVGGLVLTAVAERTADRIRVHAELRRVAAILERLDTTAKQES